MGVTDDDIRILRGLDGHLFDIWLDASVPAGGSRDLIRPDDYLVQLEDTRQWPGKDTGWDTDDASGDNPRVIARISRLARDELTSARGGEWEVIGFDYPTGSYSPFYVPVGEDAYVSVTMRRTSGDSKGEVAEVTVPSPRHSETKSARRDKKPRRADACNRGKGMKKRGYESSPVMTTSMSRSMCP